VQLFYRQVEDGLPPFVLYGSGDFHYLTALLVGRMPCPVTLVSFDNHPDWDRRPPRWSCGSWTRRALESGRVDHISVWGCGNFELRFPWRLFADPSALRSGRLKVYAWAERQGAATQRRFGCISRQDWREHFDQFSHRLTGRAVYITVDLDCLRAAEAVTDWENGLFTVADLVWAIARLAERGHVIGGDVCGAYSPSRYARWTQRIASRWDHPRLPPREADRARAINQRALDALWPAFTARARGQA
jgi:arginase family enzyme